ncbi:DNA-directed RNA polymerase subunit beta [Heyndrickxia vini]|uniref:DNA-directed RNA polymerase subunit beta n=1 Tax=Heyndrickxia vini TaxID=1476025 RepID=A0ABX7E1H7_9BACI|nr:DNA-directed RNA polymerase subunit beta [Heyndrickxia vini]QQZ09195.1 DNA-directed RNA polymerase subunit beta [Heyndrickxia vini]
MTEKEIQHNPKTREQFKKEKVKKSPKENKKVRVRLFPIWLRVIIVVFTLFISLILGVIIGYGVIGDGKPMDALKKSTWTHIIDLVNKK